MINSIDAKKSLVSLVYKVCVGGRNINFFRERDGVI